MIADVINFLTPSNEPIQIAFSSIIVVGVLSTIVWVKIKAREKSWEQKWQGKKTISTIRPLKSNMDRSMSSARQSQPLPRRLPTSCPACC